MDLSLKDVPRTPNGVIMPKNALLYYLRTPEHHPVGVVCLVAQEIAQRNADPPQSVAVLCRGIALVAEVDQWDRNTGRELAYRRALRAASLGESREPIRRPNRQHLWYDPLAEIMKAQSQRLYKIDCGITPSATEKVLLAKTKLETIPCLG